jgi:hypothetical protein
MTDLTRFIRMSLTARGVSSGVIDSFEADLVQTYRGERVYIGAKTERDRRTAEQLKRAGLSPRNAQQKAYGRR